jgi:hypothetical protein
MIVGSVIYQTYSMENRKRALVSGLIAIDCAAAEVLLPWLCFQMVALFEEVM